jgi:membrane-associated protease RseP (regulator of RpoE activity)
MMFPEPEVLTSLVSRVFTIEDVTVGDPQKFIARYRGRLYNEDSAAAYDQLDEAVKQYGLMPLFRIEKGDQIIYLVRRLPDAPPTNYRTPVILFILTVFSVMLAGAQPEGTPPSGVLAQLLFMLKSIFTGWPFALSLLSILLAHEFGHYLMSRYHKTPATLPYFIPFPLSPLGTMGAAILMRGVPKNKRILFDIGVAGPLSGMVVAIPVLFIGLSVSIRTTLAASPNGFLEGNSLFYLLAKYLSFGQWLPAPTAPQGILYWLQFFFTGHPIPFGGQDVLISSVAFAGWAGLLVTALNLLPVGTLDGGHVVYALFGEKASKGFPFILGLLGVLGIFWTGWWIWAVLLLWLGRVHVEPLDQITPLDSTRRAVAILTIILFILVFSPVPFMSLVQ